MAKKKSNMDMGAVIVRRKNIVTFPGNVHSNDENGVSITVKVGQRDIKKHFNRSDVISASDIGAGGYVTVDTYEVVASHYGEVEVTDFGFRVHTEAGRTANFYYTDGVEMEAMFDRDEDNGPITQEGRTARKTSQKWATAVARAEERASKGAKKGKGKVKNSAKKASGKGKEKSRGKGKVLGRGKK